MGLSDGYSHLKMTAEIYPDIIRTVEKLCSQVIPEVQL